MLCYANDAPVGLLNAIDSAATFHDLGKLDPDIQAALRKGRGNRLKWDHIDAGVAHLSAPGVQNWMAGWLVRAHHAPGLPQKAEHFDKDRLGRRLRGRRRDDEDEHRHREQIDRTDNCIKDYLSSHTAAVGSTKVQPQRPVHGLTMRLALSCLVDADHSDSAHFDTSRASSPAAAPRWAERLDALCRYVRNLDRGETDAEQERNRIRTTFYNACLNSPIHDAMVACEGPVGLGKTTAVTAYLIRRARDEGLRRLFVVAPYTNILTQTADRLRKALVLPGERPDHIIVEHHHRADFDQQDDRDLAVLWRAPIILTTAVNFFETLAACNPASLRKLHELPGSAVFIDEAHAALPTKLWAQNWEWLCELARKWGCRFVFASGSLVRFWESNDIVRQPVRLPDLLPRDLSHKVMFREKRRVRYDRLTDRVLTVDELVEGVGGLPGPRLVILNTVQNAAVVAQAMCHAGLDVLHLSTALTPRDRDRILKRVIRRLANSGMEWVLVATSCVEAGVDFSFRCALRERFAVTSTIQVGGRVNRHGEHDMDGGGIIYVFALEGQGIAQHPAAAVSADVLREMMAKGELNGSNPADLVTRAMREELQRLPLLEHKLLIDAEEKRDYPAVAKYGCVINADTRLVVVDARVKKLLIQRRHIDFRTLLSRSVQLWATKIEELGLDPIYPGADLFAWDDAYDPEFLGIMAGVLRNQQFLREGGAVI